jgi:hypothetical protein
VLGFLCLLVVLFQPTLLLAQQPGGVACASGAWTPEGLRDPTGGLGLSGRPGTLTERAYMQGVR